MMTVTAITRLRGGLLLLATLLGALGLACQSTLTARPAATPVTKYYENFGDTSTGSTNSCADSCAEESAFGAGFKRWVTPIDATADLMQAGRLN
jgi:hypothetical protein